ncbi:MAG: tetratricopeptide repeat protein, partial [Pseudonocardia sp.]
PQTVLDTFAQANVAVAEGRFCDALPVLDFAVTLPEAAGVAPVAHADRAHALSECGLANFRAGNLTGASTRFETLVTEYPNDPGVAQARSALIAAEVGRRASVPMALPAPIDAAGSEPVVLYNAVASEVHVLLTGPTAHEITLPACVGCPAVYERDQSCPGSAGKPSTTLQMRPGTYSVLQQRAEIRPTATVNQPVTVPRGGGELCVRVNRVQ